LEKLERETAKSKDIVIESRQRINREIRQARDLIQEKYREIKERISASIMPT